MDPINSLPEQFATWYVGHPVSSFAIHFLFIIFILCGILVFVALYKYFYEKSESLRLARELHTRLTLRNSTLKTHTPPSKRGPQ